MVTILPPRTSIGQQLGLQAGQGLQQGIQQGANIGFQRGLLQKALGDVKAAAQSPEANALDTTLAFLQATAGIPGSEKYVGQVLPMLLNQMSLAKREQLGEERPGASPMGMPQMQGQLPTTQALYEGERPKTGFFQTPLTNEEIQQRALQLAETRPGDPQAFERAYQSELQQNEALKAQQQEFDAMASNLEKIKQDPTSLPLFRKIAEKYSGLGDKFRIFEKAKRDFYNVQNDLSSIDNIVIPYGKSLTAKGIGPREFTREKTIERLQPIAKRLVDQGFEQELRNKLTMQGLGPTEVNLALHPLRKELNQLSKIYSGKTTEDLSSFLTKNINSGDTLLGLRDALKGKVSWEQFRDALENAYPAIQDRLTPWQQTERAELLNPPKDSLASLFRGFISDYFRGAK